MRRMTVLWTFRRPCMGRPVPRQLMRHEWVDLTTIMPATACHRRSYAARYRRFNTGSTPVQHLPPSDPIMAYRQFRFEPEPFEGVQQEPVDVWHSCRDWTQSWVFCQRFWPPTNRQTCAMLRLQRRS